MDERRKLALESAVKVAEPGEPMVTTFQRAVAFLDFLEPRPKTSSGPIPVTDEGLQVGAMVDGKYVPAPGFEDYGKPKV